MERTVEFTEAQKKARKVIQNQLILSSEEDKIDLVVSYYKQGHSDGIKLGIKQTMAAIKMQIDGIWEQLNATSAKPAASPVDTSSASEA